MKRLELKDFRVSREGKKIDLRKLPTRVEPFYESKAEAKKSLEKQSDRLKELQTLFYAYDRYSLLLVFQAMDAAGKDGAIKQVMSGVNPQGCQVHSFKHPSAEELDHDFLWRAACRLPERGRIGIFNRSYYEEVLVVRVHPKILNAQKLPHDCVKGESVWESRYRSIRDFEAHLHRNGTRVVKFFLHVSKREQAKRFRARLDDPQKNWKFNLNDVDERKYWNDYRRAYEECIAQTSTQDSPWYVVPADDKKNARLIISEAILEALKTLKMHYPPCPIPPGKRAAIRRRLS